MALKSSDYLVVFTTLENPRLRLVCFPHSGGGAAVFSKWSELLADHDVEVVAVSLPGRERRLGETPHKEWQPLVRSVCNELKASGVVDGVPYALLGHSLGALMAYEVARLLEAELLPGRPRPVHLFASGHGAPETANCAKKRALSEKTGDGIPWGNLHKLGDGELVSEVGKFGALPAQVALDPDIASLIIPALRADFQVYETYCPETSRKALDLPITVLGGKEDIIASVEQLHTWGAETAVELKGPVLFPGGHFFIDSEREAVVLNTVLPHLRESLRTLPRSMLASDLSIPEVCETKTIHEVFFEQAMETPAHEALVDEDARVSYSDLARRVQLLASYLQTNYLEGKSGEVVAMVMPHNATYVTCMLAISAAAAKLLVIEAHFNRELCREICEESFAVLAIASSKHAAKFEGVKDCQTIVLDDAGTFKFVAPLGEDGQSLSALDLPRAELQDISILMMTSGTTGRPKTIAGTHYFMHLGIRAKNALIPYEETDNREAFNVMFVWEVLRPLVFGLTSFIIPDEAVLETELFVKALQQHKCSRVLTTPSLLSTILRYSSQGLENRLGSMRTWLACGEVLPMATVRRFREALPQCRLVNDYSCWEAADVAYAITSPQPAYEPSDNFASAGVIAPGCLIVIVDPNTMEVLPYNTIGEIYVGGKALSSGYYLKPDATKERFVDGFTEEMTKLWSGKWYKSGDSGRILGNPAFLEVRGRIDSTVKIRGFKVGIPIVEGGIQAVEGVAMCAIMPVYSAPGIVDSLLCYVQPEGNLSYDDLVARIKQEGPKKMPRWMMPANFQPMPSEAFSGGEAKKIDRKALARMTEQFMAERSQSKPSSDDEEMPSVEVNGVQAVVKAVWVKALNLDPNDVDLEENFFDIGGHSNLAAQIAALLSNEHGLKITVLDIYSNPTLGGLLAFLAPEADSTLPETKLPRLPRSTAATGDSSIAVVGMAGRFPGAKDIEVFWENLRQGAVSATFLSKDLLAQKGIPADVIGHKE
jgi:surfactin synthase thioesterase subunit/acyl-CoA synthetase (AMP-forming)/AMP-acid ligase II